MRSTGSPITLALALALMAATPRPGSADQAAAGQASQMFEAKGCGECHYSVGPAREKTIDDQLAKKGPELWYAGSKFQADWLGGWLQDPKPIRLLAYNSLTEENPGDHPALGGDDAALVSDYLMSLTTDVVEAGKVKVKKKNPKGRLVFIKKMPCSGCHQYPGKKAVGGGRSGPSLLDAGLRLNPDWVLAYLQNPTVFKPVKMMPVFVGLLRDKDMANVAGYVATFKGAK